MRSIDRNFFPFHKAKGGIAALAAGGSYFQSHQGEYWQMGGRWGSIAAQLFIIECEDGKWLADRCAYQDEPRYDTRDLALEAAIAGVIQQVTWMVRDWRQLNEVHGNHIIRWAASIGKLPAPAPLEAPPPEPPPVGTQGQLF